MGGETSIGERRGSFLFFFHCFFSLSSPCSMSSRWGGRGVGLPETKYIYVQKLAYKNRGSRLFLRYHSVFLIQILGTVQKSAFPKCR